MATTRPSFEDLSAFVDGELPPGRAAEVAAAVAADPATARTVARLAELKGHVATLADADPAMPTALPRVRRLGPVAAGLALALGAGVAAWLAVGADGLPPAAQVALDLHRAPAAGGAQGVAAQALLATRVPDLTDTRLSFAAKAIVERDGVSALHVAYRGTRGCRLDLFVYPRPLDATALAAFAGRPHAAAWNDAGRGYAVLATAMDDARFALILEAIRQQIGGTARLSAAIRRDLAAARLRSRPCST